jgi:bifunctional non-homologous end joining protein LigD
MSRARLLSGELLRAHSGATTNVSGEPVRSADSKHDGFGVIVRHEGAQALLFTRGGYDWADRFPAIVEAASMIRAQWFLIDGEAVVCGHDGLSDFDALRSRRRDHDVTLIAEPDANS